MSERLTIIRYAPMVRSDPDQKVTQVDMRVGRVVAPLREQVLEVLRQAILDFHFRPGDRLIERELIEQTGVSRSTIREVLRELDAEGLVTTVPQKGVIVVAPSPEQAGDLYEVRAALEELAVRCFVERASDDQLARLREVCDEFEEVASEGVDTKSLLAVKDSFYRVLLEGADNSVISSVLGGLQARVRMLRAASLSNEGRVEHAAAETGDIVAAAERRDAETAVTACRIHLERAAASGIQGLSDLDPSGATEAPAA